MIIFINFIVILFFRFVFVKHHHGAWPTQGWSTAHLTSSRILEYYKLYLPSALALGSDFWRMAVVGVLAARQGVLEVAVFTVGYRFLWLCLIVTSSVARAAGIQISISIGQGCVGAAIIQAKVIIA